MNFRHELVFCVGMPVNENPTGIMMDAAFADCNLLWRYQLIESSAENLSTTLAGIRTMGIAGANITIPHKEHVIAHLDELAPSAKIIGAVNTITRQNNRLIGHNTDGQGFVHALRANASTDPAGAHAFIVGAGGAARAIAVETALAGAAQITLINRDNERAHQLCNDIQPHLKMPINVQDWNSSIQIPPSANIVVNATSVGLYPDTHCVPIDWSSIKPNMLVVDVIPNPPQTLFLANAQAAGARTLSGLGMLVQQGAIAFELWTSIPAPVQVMHNALSGALASS